MERAEKRMMLVAVRLVRVLGVCTANLRVPLETDAVFAYSKGSIGFGGARSKAMRDRRVAVTSVLQYLNGL